MLPLLAQAAPPVLRFEATVSAGDVTALMPWAGRCSLLLLAAGSATLVLPAGHGTGVYVVRVGSTALRPTVK